MNNERISGARHMELWRQAEAQCIHGSDGRLIYPAHDADGRSVDQLYWGLVLKEADAIIERRIAAVPNV